MSHDWVNTARRLDSERGGRWSGLFGVILGLLLLGILVRALLAGSFSVIGTSLAEVGMALIVGLDVAARGTFIPNPILAWVVLGLIVGLTVGLSQGYRASGYRRAAGRALLIGGAVLVALVAVSLLRGAPPTSPKAPPSPAGSPRPTHR